MDRKAEETQSISAELEQFLLPSRLERLDGVVQNRTRSLVIVLDQVMNAHNISAVMRSMDAFGVQELHLIGDSFEFSGGISLGSERWLELKKYQNSAAVIESLRGRGFKFVVLRSPLSEGEKPRHCPTVQVNQLPFSEKLALVFGNEHRGVSEEFMTSADLFAFIPMLGFVESFNISVAAAITMFCSTLGPVDGKRLVAPLEAEDLARLKHDWVKGSLRHGELVLKELEERKAR